MRGVVRESTGRALLQPGTQHQTTSLVRGVVEGKPLPDCIVSEVEEWEGKMEPHPTPPFALPLLEVVAEERGEVDIVRRSPAMTPGCGEVYLHGAVRTELRPREGVRGGDGATASGTRESGH
jgi:hypothetical protein